MVSNIFYVHLIWGRFPCWLIFFRWVETTNQRWSTCSCMWSYTRFCRIWSHWPSDLTIIKEVFLHHPLWCHWSSQKNDSARWWIKVSVVFFLVHLSCLFFLVVFGLPSPFFKERSIQRELLDINQRPCFGCMRLYGQRSSANARRLAEVVAFFCHKIRYSFPKLVVQSFFNQYKYILILHHSYYHFYQLLSLHIYPPSFLVKTGSL